MQGHQVMASDILDLPWTGEGRRHGLETGDVFVLGKCWVTCCFKTRLVFVVCHIACLVPKRGPIRTAEIPVVLCIFFSMLACRTCLAHY